MTPLRSTSRSHRLLFSGVLAVAFQLCTVGVAYADDCAAYFRNPKYLIGAPRWLLEDCARTPYAQAVITALASSAAGAAIAAALSRVLLQAAQQGERRASDERRERNTRILSGAEALAWLRQKDFIRGGQPTDKFTRWQRRSPSSDEPDEDGLGAMTGEWDWGEQWGTKGQRIDTGLWDPKKKKWIREPEITIVVDDDRELPSSSLPEKPELPQKEELVKEPPKKEPPPKEPEPPRRVEESLGDPCPGPREELRQAQTEVEKVCDEYARMQEQARGLDRIWRNKAICMGVGGVIDVGTTTAGLLLLTNPAFWGSPAGGMLISGAADVAKTAIKNRIDTDPEGYAGNVAKGQGQVAISEGLDRFVQYLVKNGVSRAAAEKLGKAVGGGVGMGMSMALAAHDIAQSRMQLAILAGQRENLVKLLDKTESFIKQACGRRAAAFEALIDCHKRFQDYLEAMRNQAQ